MAWVQHGGCPLRPSTAVTSGAGFALASSSCLLWVRQITPFPFTEHELSLAVGISSLKEMSKMDPSGLH